MAKIIILDDHPDICKFLRVLLASAGHEVRTSQVGDEAIDFGYLFQPDILITDWRLNCEYDGLEVADAFRVANKSIKTILMTGYSLSEVKKQVSNLDIFKIITKPFSGDTILKSVNEALKSQRQIGFSLN